MEIISIPIKDKPEEPGVRHEREGVNGACSVMQKSAWLLSTGLWKATASFNNVSWAQKVTSMTSYKICCRPSCATSSVQWQQGHPYGEMRVDIFNDWPKQQLVKRGRKVICGCTGLCFAQYVCFMKSGDDRQDPLHSRPYIIQDMVAWAQRQFHKEPNFSRKCEVRGGKRNRSPITPLQKGIKQWTRTMNALYAFIIEDRCLHTKTKKTKSKKCFTLLFFCEFWGWCFFLSALSGFVLCF